MKKRKSYDSISHLSFFSLLSQEKHSLQFSTFSVGVEVSIIVILMSFSVYVRFSSSVNLFLLSISSPTCFIRSLFKPKIFSL